MKTQLTLDGINIQNYGTLFRAAFLSHLLTQKVSIYIYTKGSIAIDGRCLRRCSVDLRKARYLTLLHGSLPLPRTVPSPGPQAWDWALAGYPAAFRMTQVMAFQMMLSHYRSVLNCGYMPQDDVNTSAEKTKSSQMARVKHAHSRQASEIKTKKCYCNICGVHRGYTHKTKITRQKSKPRHVKAPRV